MTPFDRRAFLRGAGGLLLALPTLNSLGCRRESSATPFGSRAQKLDIDKRLIMFFTSFGASPGAFFPTGGTETNFVLPPTLAPFAPHQQDLLLLEEIDLLPFIRNGFNAVGHGAPLAYVVGGWPIFQGDSTPGAGGISLDQKIARHIGTPNRLQSLPINLGNSNQYLTSSISYTGPMERLAAFRDPVTAYNRVFEGFNVPPAVLQAIHADRRSVLDFVMDDYATLSTKVSAEDRRIVDFHLQSVRELETRLATIASSPVSCEVDPLNNPPRDLGTWQQGTGPDFVAIAEFQMDLIVMALACDITRVATMSWTGEMSWDGSVIGLGPGMTTVGDAHLASHENFEAFNRITNWYSQRFSTFIQKLKDRGIFDRSLFMWLSENGAGGPATHSPFSMPYLLAGNAGGAFRTGRHIKCGHRSPNDLYVSIQQAFQLPDPVFGDPAECTGPINQLF
ncbi:MAG: DUF1552 domain-containing protein [Myxococcaceae bacterium]